MSEAGAAENYRLDLETRTGERLERHVRQDIWDRSLGKMTSNRMKELSVWYRKAFHREEASLPKQKHAWS